MAGSDEPAAKLEPVEAPAQTPDAQTPHAQTPPAETLPGEPPPVETAALSPAEAAVAIARIDVRVVVAAPTKPGELVLLAPDPVDEDPFADAEPTAPRRAADLLPPRNRRPAFREEAATLPRARRLVAAQNHDTAPEGAEGQDNALPPGTPRPVIGQPLFAQEWGAAAQGTPTWRPGAPPVDPRQDRGSWYVVGATALLGVGAMLLWLWWWT